MMDNIIIGKYVPGKSVIHRLDPRTKLLTIFLLSLSFFANNTETYALLGLFTVAAAALSGVPVRFLIKE